MMVKICGITRPDDALAAVTAGAQAIGFVFWPGSPRAITAEAARVVVRMLPPFVTTVGVFVNQTLAQIQRTVERSGISVVQLHGDEAPELAEALSVPVIKAVSQVTQALDAWPDRVTLLVDAHDPVRRGGTGQTADWDAAAQLARQRRIVLAGGLNAGNVAAAVAHVRPFGIDVSSGVESAPGIKDVGKIGDLFRALKVS